MDEPIADRFVRVKPIGDSGKGVVWLANDRLEPARKAAVRLLPPALLADARAAAQLSDAVREAEQLTGELLSALLAFETERAPCIVTEHVPGGSLAAKLVRGPLDVFEALRIGDALCRALARVHDRGVAHGAVTPHNVMLHAAADGVTLPRLKDAVVGAFLTTWQLARRDETAAARAAFLAPEVRAGAAPDPRADVWSLGATLAAVLGTPAGAPPRAHGSLGDLLRSMLAADPAARPAIADVAPAIERERWQASQAMRSGPPRPWPGPGAVEPVAPVPEPLPGAAAFAWLGARDAVTSPTASHLRAVGAAGAGALLDVREQVIRIEIPERHRDSGLTPWVQPERGGSFVSAAALAHKAKQFDDGLYAAVELAAQKGKARMIASACKRLAGDARAPEGNAATVLFAAAELAGMQLIAPANISTAVESEVAGFLANTARSKPLAFYTWSAELTAIFRQDRMLQTELAGDAGIRAVAEALAADPAGRAAYERTLALSASLTNPLTRPDLRPLLARPDGAIPRGLTFFPPSRSHENALADRLLGTGDAPEGFSFIDELIKRVRSGEISLAPRAGAGWYDHQTWALEPLLRPDLTAEAPRLALGERYRGHLTELFRGVLALTRETHAKQLDARAGGMWDPPVAIQVSPGLTLEPLPAHYLRRAASYRFVRGVLEEAFGERALRGMARLCAAGPVPADLDAELRGMELLFSGAHARSSRELGAAVDPSVDADRALAVFEAWRKDLGRDADLGRDCRMMVPVRIESGGVRVWAFFGWKRLGLAADFARPPRIERTDPRVTVEFTSEHHAIVQPVSRELVVPRLLDRGEFRALCDKLRDPEAIARALS